MEDNKLDQLLDEARATYRVPPAPATDALWQRIEAETFAAPAHTAARTPARRDNEWRIAWRLAAASLLVGVVAGRWSAGIGSIDPSAPATEVRGCSMQAG